MNGKLVFSLKGLVFMPVNSFGRYLIFLSENIRRFFFPPISIVLLVKQMEFVGNRSIGVIFMAAAMVGAAFALQFGEIFKTFGAESFVGVAAGIALSKELAPLMGSFIVTGRAGSAMAAEIATMRVNEQIDAMKVMSVNPHSYLIAPRILGSVIMLPLLTGMFILIGTISTFLISVAMYNVDVGVFVDKMQWIVRPSHVMEGLQKSAIFGLILSSIGCYKGFYASGGAKGVGKAVTEAVVFSLVSILVVDFFVSYVILKLSSGPV